MSEIRLAHDIVVPVGTARTMRVRVWGELGTAPPLVVLHGLLDSSDSWDAFAATREETIVALDLPGFGGSSPALAPTLQAFASDIACALLWLGIRRYQLAGHSLGGAVATELATTHPERVTGLVLLAPAGFGRIPLAELAGLPVLRDAIGAALPRALRWPRAVRAGYRLVVSPRRSVEAPQHLASIHETPTIGMAAGVRALVQQGHEVDRWDRRYDGPVFAVWGREDLIVPPQHADSLRRVLPQADVLLISGLGHDPIREQLALVHRLADRAQHAPVVALAA